MAGLPHIVDSPCFYHILGVSTVFPSRRCYPQLSWLCCSWFFTVVVSAVADVVGVVIVVVVTSVVAVAVVVAVVAVVVSGFCFSWHSFMFFVWFYVLSSQCYFVSS